MRQQRSEAISCLLGRVFMVTALAGCAAAPPAAPSLGVPLHTVRYPQADKYALKVSLELSRELQDATWNIQDVLGMPRTVALGSQLAHNAEGLTRHLFADVVVARQGDSVPLEGVAAILTPRLAYSQYLPRPVFSTTARPPVLVIGLEWSLRSPTGVAIWTETVRAELNEPFPPLRETWGKSIDAISDAWIRRAIDRAFLESFYSLSSAKAIGAWR